MYLRIIILLLCMACLNSASSQGKVFIPYRTGKLWGYSDTAGNMLMPAQYQDANWFYQTPVQSSKTLIPCAFVKKGGKYYYIDKLGKKVKREEFHIGHVIAEAPVFNMNLYRSIPNGGKSYDFNTGKHGFTTNDSIQLFPYIYDDAFWVKDGYGCFKKGGFIGVVDMQGKTIVPFAYKTEYDLILPPDSSGLMQIVLNAVGVADSLKRAGYMSVNGHWILKPSFNELSYIHTGPPIGETVTLIRLSYNQHTNTSRLDTIKKQIPQFSVWVKKGNSEGILRSDGKWEVPMGLYDIGDTYPYPYVLLSQNDKKLGWMNVVKNRKYWRE